MKTIEDAVLVFNTRKEVQSQLLKMGLLSNYSGKKTKRCTLRPT